MSETIHQAFQESIRVKQELLRDPELMATIEEVIHLMVSTFEEGHRVFFCGNGGSAADAQHLAAELSGRFYIDRRPLPAEALHCNTSFLTAVANDYSYEEVYARLLQAMAQPGDLLWALSTSGNSRNVIRAIEVAQQIPIRVIGFTGKTGGAMKHMCDYLINVPSDDTPRIQEAHMLIGHTICQLTEQALFGYDA
ncbi:MAG: D-sedoheptulose 7-phosphate isomerase [Thermoflavifilum sp.]|nr:D-sedoheptulose 7-phosphate isomerase [Thermoflavifilum sp.]